MRAQLHGILCAALGGALAVTGCGLIEGLGGLQFDLPQPDGGAGGGSGAGGGAPDAGRDAATVDAAPDATPDATPDAATDATPDAAACPVAGDDCGAPPPAGWSGPIAFYEGAPGTTPPCPGEYPVVVAQGRAGLSAPPATCSACSCGAPSVTCGMEPLVLYSEWNCPAPPDATLMLASATCTPLKGTSDHFVQTAPTANVSACTPAGGLPSLPPPAWTMSGIACGLSDQATACADGSVCAPLPPAPFDARWCIWQAGAPACPAGFPTQHVWEMAADGRGCTPCTCGSPSAATCSVTTQFYSDSACQTSIDSLSLIGACTHEASVRSVSATTTPAGSPSCSTGGGNPEGSVTAAPAMTICCAP